MADGGDNEDFSSGFARTSRAQRVATTALITTHLHVQWSQVGLELLIFKRQFVEMVSLHSRFIKKNHISTCIDNHICSNHRALDM